MMKSLHNKSNEIFDLLSLSLSLSLSLTVSKKIRFQSILCPKRETSWTLSQQINKWNEKCSMNLSLSLSLSLSLYLSISLFQSFNFTLQLENPKTSQRILCSIP